MEIYGMEVNGIKNVDDWPYPWALNDAGTDWLKRRSIGPSLCLMLSVRHKPIMEAVIKGKGKSASLLRRLWCRTVTQATSLWVLMHFLFVFVAYSVQDGSKYIGMLFPVANRLSSVNKCLKRKTVSVNTTSAPSAPSATSLCWLPPPPPVLPRAYTVCIESLK